MIVSIEALIENKDLALRGAIICDRLGSLRIDENSDIERKLLTLSFDELRSNVSAKNSAADLEFWTINTRKILDNPDSNIAVRGNWERPFCGEDFTKDLESFCSDIMGRRMRTRTLNAVAMNTKTGVVGHKYPPPYSIPPGLRAIDELVNSDVCRSNPIIELVPENWTGC